MKLKIVFFLLLSFCLVQTDDTIQCQLCINLVNNLKEIVEKDGADIAREAAEICDKITLNISILDAMCKRFAIEEIDNIIQGLKRNNSAETICNDINICHKLHVITI
uniref:Saposin B-type domain-containing protein n=1 Tax=Parastrongyloides trichosuri TaxID=131310 RepID=A0A0N4ZUW0_PARTI